MVGPEPGRTRVLVGAEWNDDGRYVVAYVSDQDGYTHQVETEMTADANQWRWRDDRNREITIRPTRESDSETARNHPFFPPHPLPVPVIGGIMAGTLGDTILYAATDSDGDVHTLILETGLGLYARYARTWQKVGDASAISHLNMIRVAETDVEVYDQADENQRQLPLAAFTPQTQVGGNSAGTIITEPAPETVTASAPIVAPIIASLDDADTAIQFAAENPSARWYVAKRLRALDYADPFPWET